jgi:hypothetical protein
MPEHDAGRSSLDVELEWPSTHEARAPAPAHDSRTPGPAHLAPDPTDGAGDATVAPLPADLVMQLVDELREDLRGLRVAVLDWPDLAGLRTAVAELRTAVAELQSDFLEGSGLTALQAQVAELRDLLIEGPVQELGAQLADVRTQLERGARAPELRPVLEELGAIRADLVSLRRRIALRAQADPARSFDDEVEAIAAAVLLRLTQSGELPDRIRR